MSRQLLLFPFGGNAREAVMSVFALNERGPAWDLVGFIDDDRSLRGKECCGVRVLGGRELLRELPDAFVLAVPGSPTNYAHRKEIIDAIGVDRSRFATVCHPSVAISPDAAIGVNTLLMANVVVTAGVTIGSHCVILPNTVVSHDSVVSDYCCIGSNVSISGSVTLGSHSYLGSGTRVREKVSIGERTLVGIGSNVIADIPAGVLAVGNPARVLRSGVP